MSNELPAVEVDARPVYDGGHWRADAKCRSVDPNLFFPRGHTGDAAEQAAAAKSVCAECPVAAPCLTFAVVTNQEFGVWGGADEDERRAIRRRWRTERHVV